MTDLSGFRPDGLAATAMALRAEFARILKDVVIVSRDTRSHAAVLDQLVRAAMIEVAKEHAEAEALRAERDWLIQ